MLGQLLIPPIQTLEKIYNIKTYRGPGTGFALQHQGRSFLVTAEHLIGGTLAGDKVLYRILDDWNEFEVSDVHRTDEQVDLAIVEVKQEFDTAFSIEDLDAAHTLGLPVAFAGYPIGLRTSAFKLGHTRPMPFLRYGRISGWDDHNNTTSIFIDAINNKGFSGAPVFRAFGEDRLFIMAVVVEYKNDREQAVYCRDDVGVVHTVENRFIIPNSGFTVALSSLHIAKLIEDICG